MTDVVVATPDMVSLGVLAGVVDRARVEDAVMVCGARAQRSGGKLPPHVVAYLTMALCLFGGDSYEEVAVKVTGALTRWGCWDAGWSPPTASGITQARKRLGPKVLERVFESVAAPVATPATRGAWLAGRRLVAIDGFDVDVADTESNVAEFGYHGSGDNRSTYPKARVVALSECGTHVFLAAEVTAITVGERAAAARLYPRLLGDEILCADRGFYSFDAWAAAKAGGAELVWRAPTNLRLPVVRVHADGTYVSVLIDPAVQSKRRRAAILAAAAAGEDLDEAEDAHLVRVVEYDVPDRNPDGELIVLLTTLTDPAAVRADQIAGAYHERWEHETANDQLKTHLRGPGAVLRSKSPELVHQEIWAWLTVHYAIAAVMARAAEAADLDPDRISFIHALNIIRRTATGTAAFPPSPLDRPRRDRLGRH
ncbi:IS4 family transposase [Nocardia sp. alder85J]|uniref:IS4 family transposase n=1 Tax=Nocardia sp. alder85J TaxID=2862949 RepID=UPI001CD49CD0|nr:IS4 family transposase [Nocardia sp. alder85J]MCX4091065.1 IS4 family transposase [Nocardia sp. alder85J]MCX4094528.1 IS4 family transposase [Nocardia sp. alder85J]MCX4095301.1 IS4 family transposase [Nocardia sp. alder85J]MCX4097298.1 IS4 family transposase [Nocardia sp. alder85J]MCX4097657.1 IS4 family transposase [Nocardia sp. alder85J]